MTIEVSFCEPCKAGEGTERYGLTTAKCSSCCTTRSRVCGEIIVSRYGVKRAVRAMAVLMRLQKLGLKTYSYVSIRSGYDAGSG
jgi:hypothetical protein